MGLDEVNQSVGRRVMSCDFRVTFQVAVDDLGKRFTQLNANTKTKKITFIRTVIELNDFTKKNSAKVGAVSNHQVVSCDSVVVSAPDLQFGSTNWV
jgi:hypothetical protein